MIRILSVAFLLLTGAAQAADAPTRVISVGGAITEIIYALGAGDRVVASDTTSYYPPEAAKTPKVGYMRALSAEGVLSMSPDLVILAADAGPPPVIEQLDTAGVNLLKIGPARTIEDVKSHIEIVAKALHRQAEGTALIEQITAQEEKLKERIAGQGEAKRVLFILQHGGGAPMVAGNLTSADSIIKLAGAVNVVDEYDGYKPLSPESAISLAPDVILATDQGVQQAGGEASFLSAPGIALTPAGKNGQLVAMDALLLLGFGPRAVDAALELNDRLNTQ